MNNQPKFNLEVMANVMTSISHYYEMVNYFPTVDTNNINLKDFLNKNIPENKTFYNSEIASRWYDIRLHIISQSWGSTSCGWGGMGGAAISYEMNIVIHNPRTNLFFVFWGSRLAYVAEWNESVDFSRLPSRTDCDSKLKILYLPKYN